jgi:UDP-N-acetylmuramate--alanine ligase
MKINKKQYYFLGICGVSMSGIAKLLSDQGHGVRGSDLRKCDLGNKIDIYHGHNMHQIDKSIDELIYTSAAENKKAPGYVELQKARSINIKTTKRSKFIGKIMNDKYGIAITGMHGKTTVSTMVSLILEEFGFDPICLIGSYVKEWGSNVRNGNPVKTKNNRLRQYFLTEACEYDRQMLDFRPQVALITNMDEEHLDTYKNGMKDIRQAFKKFVKLLPKNGLLVLCKDDKNVASLTKYAKCKVKYYSYKEPWPGLKLKVSGKHNLQNATGAARLSHELGVDHKTITKVLNGFTGAARRCEIKGEKRRLLVIDDYGHHPTEIKATLKGIKEKYPDKKLIVVYQPHQQQRTKLLFNDFVKSFDVADEIIINKVYLIAGREKESKNNLAKLLADKLNQRGKKAIYLDTYSQIGDYVKGFLGKDSVLLTMGATDIYKVGNMILNVKK